MILPLLVSEALAVPRGVERQAEAPPGLDDVMVRRVAVVVGIDAYADRELGPLDYASKDARDVADLLRDPERGAFSEVHLVGGGEVGRDELWAAIERHTAALQPNDTFVLYFAGHSTLRLTPDGTQLYLLASDGRLAEPEATGVAIDRVERFLDGLHVRQQVMIVDACQSLSTETRARVDGLRGPVPDPMAWLQEPGASEVHLYSAALYQAAQEDPDLQNGVYTHFLLEGLRGEADEDGDGRVEVMEAHRFAAARTMAHTKQTQVPRARTRSMGREQIFLAGPPVSVAELGSADARPGNERTRGGAPARWTLGTGPSLSLDPYADVTTVPFSWSLVVSDRRGRWQPSVGLASTVGAWPDPTVVTMAHPEARLAYLAGRGLQVGAEAGIGVYTRIHSRAPRYYDAGVVEVSPSLALGAPLRAALSPRLSTTLTPRVTSAWVVSAPALRLLPQATWTVELAL